MMQRRGGAGACTRRVSRYIGGIHLSLSARADAMSTDTPSTQQTHAFQAEVAQLLHLMVHSVYSESDVFLRELISNASDACDRLRYEAIAKPELMGDGAAARDPHHAGRRRPARSRSPTPASAWTARS